MDRSMMDGWTRVYRKCIDWERQSWSSSALQKSQVYVQRNR